MTTVVTVSWNTCELTAFLLWSLRRFRVEAPVVVVDNGSTDGSAAMLQAVAAARACSLLPNAHNIGHGPALNQALARVRSGRVWVLDSDCVVARADVLDALPRGAAVVGERFWDRWHERHRFELCSLVLDVGALSSSGAAFADDGDPSWPVLSAVEGAGLPMADFPFLADGWVIHRGRSSLASLASSGDTSHPLHGWAVDHHEPHFGGVDGAATRHAQLLAEFRSEVGCPLEIDRLVSSLTASESPPI